MKFPEKLTPGPLRLRHQLLIVRKYEKPDSVRGLWVSPAWKTDHSRSLWEVVQSSPEADAEARINLMPGWIVVTPRNSGVFLDHETYTRSDGRPAVRERFLLHAGLILRIIPWTSGEDMKTLGSRILVRPDDPTHQSGPIFVPESVKKAIPVVTGKIVDVGPDVEDEDVVEGARILYSLYAGTYMDINGERRLLMEASQAMMVLDEETKVEAVIR